MALPDMTQFLGMPESARTEVLEAIAQRLGHPWYAAGDVLVLSDSDVPVDLEDEAPEGEAFVFVPGGSFRPGLSQGERATMQRWLEEAQRAEQWHASRPPPSGGRVEVISESVEVDLSVDEQALTGLIDRAFGRSPDRSPHLKAERYELRRAPEASEICPFTMHAEVEVIEQSIAELANANPWGPTTTVGPFLMAEVPFSLRDWHVALGSRAPTDREWEWAYRAGTTTVFWHGDTPPDDRAMGLDLLELDADPTGHPLGLLGMGWAEECCVGEQHPNDGVRTFRGGAESTSPWQGCGEFFSLASAYRNHRSYGTPVPRPVFALRL